jgi:glycerol-3-phosphate dehydrogenase (NAD(P)+)
MSQEKALVLGCGAWGTTIAKLIGLTSDVTVFCHNEAIKNEINTSHTNSLYLPVEPPLPKRVTAIVQSEISDCLKEVTYIFVVVASAYYRSILASIAPLLNEQHIIVSATKGMEEGTNKSVLDMALEELGQIFFDTRYCILSGPNLAKEIYMEKPAATTVACKSLDVAKKVQEFISSSQFRVYVNDDIIGVEMGGVLKNCIAIAAGMGDALDVGSNAKSALLVRGMSEIVRYSCRHGAKEITLMGMSGYGDLITTCMGPSSRNYSVGFRIGKGETLAEITESMVDVAEGVKSCKVVHEVARKEHFDMPIISSIYAVLYDGAPIREALTELMTRELKEES